MAGYLVSTTNDAGSGGGGTASVLAAAIVAIGSGVSSISVNYSSVLLAAGVPVFSFVNTIDATPIFLQGIITAFSTSGFTATFNAPTDTANYQISYHVTAAI